jgi:tetratricopeptide (TPR) repeat protein
MGFINHQLIPSLFFYCSVYGAVHGFLGSSIQAEVTKQEFKVQTETLSRGRATVLRRVETQRVDSYVLTSRDYVVSKQAAVDRKTVDLIKQIENLLKRPAQKAREGELKMRLAELYFDFSQSLALKEGEGWEAEVKAWEKQSEGTKTQRPRPLLKTPKADALRKKTLTLYQDLEKKSRDSNNAKSSSINRVEVLYFLATTLLDLGKRKEAIPHFEELARRYPNSPRALATHINLADLLFERKSFSEAIPHYLVVAAEKNLARELESIRIYAIYKLGWCYQNTREFDKAVSAFRKTLLLAESPVQGRKIVFENEVLLDLAMAFVNAEQFSEGEEFFKSRGTAGISALKSFYRQAALASEDRARFTEAVVYLDKLIQLDPETFDAKDFAVEKLTILLKAKKTQAYLNELKNFAEQYGVGTRWWRAQNVNVQKIATEEMVALLRRETKNRHKIAQTKNETSLYTEAADFYAIFFKYVPEPNPDTVDNVSEMRFYYGELLYKLGRYLDAEAQYKLVTDKKFSSVASYNQILALQKTGLIEKNPELSQRFQNSVERFIELNPNDSRAAQLMYLSATQAFQQGDTQESIQKLEKVIGRFSQDKMGVDAAERILFILEKNEDLLKLAEKARVFSTNKNLIKTGGEKFENKLKNMANLAEFKAIEKLSESGDQELSEKAKGFLTYSTRVKDELKEKALQNARVYAEKSGDKALVGQIENVFLKEFPSSDYSRDIYLKRGQAFVEVGDWARAKGSFESFHKLFGQKASPQGEAALWNLIFIEMYLEDLTVIAINPRQWASANLINRAKNYLSLYPKGKNRVDVIELLSFFNQGLKIGELETLRRMDSLTSAEKKILNEAEWVLRSRAGDVSALKPLSQTPSSLPGPLAKEIVSKELLKKLQPDFESFQKAKLDFSAQKFVGSLKSKLDRLENLEKQYLSVVQLGVAVTAFSSLERLSRAYTQMGEDIQKAPIDKAELATFTDPLFEKAKIFIQRCIDKGIEIKFGGRELESCRVRAKALGVDDFYLENEKIPKPEFVPSTQALQFTQPILNGTLQAASEKKWGEVKLGIKVMALKENSLTREEKAFYYLVKGIESYQAKDFESSAKYFRFSLEGSAETGIPQMGRKNLTALYLEVGDTSAAYDTISASDPQDPMGALLFGVSAKGEGELDASIKAYEYGLNLAPNDTRLLYNLALALASSNIWAGAIQNLQKFIELTSPPANDETRLLLSRWRTRSNQNKNLPEVSL